MVIKDKLTRLSPQSCSIVLCQTQNSGNVGSVARAMAVMGFEQLILVDCRCAIDSQAYKMACHASFVLDKARLVKSLDEIVTANSYVIGFCNRPRHVGPPQKFLPEALDRIQSELVDDNNAFCKKYSALLLVFGSENFGLHNKDISYCDEAWQIPTFHKSYSSLNLSQAVQIATYSLAPYFHHEDKIATTQPKKQCNFQSHSKGSFQALNTLLESLSTHSCFRQFLSKSTAHQTQNRLTMLFKTGLKNESDMKFMIGFLKAFDNILKLDQAKSAYDFAN